MKLLLILLFISILTDIVDSKQNYTKKSIEDHKPRHTPNPRIKRDIEDKPTHTPSPHKPTPSPTPSPTNSPTPSPTPAPTLPNKGGFLIFI
jgi:hypothetical protein